MGSSTALSVGSRKVEPQSKRKRKRTPSDSRRCERRAAERTQTLHETIADARKRRERARVELAQMDPWRPFTFARIDAEIEQLEWELKLGWTGDPGFGPAVPRRMPLPARPYVLPREVLAIRRRGSQHSSSIPSGVRSLLRIDGKASGASDED